MDFDFNLILVPATLLFFFIWLLDKFVLKQRKTRGKGNESLFVSWAYDIWPILAFVLIVRSFFYEPYNIPSDSMVPTLETGDFILVDKNAYGVRLPLLHTKILDTGSPERGDVAVFRFPPRPSVYFIKRVIGLPGDVIRFDNNRLYINDQQILSTPVEFTRDPELVAQLNAKEQKQIPYYQQQTIDEKRRLEARAQYFRETIDGETYLIRDFQSAWVNGDFMLSQSKLARTSEGRKWQIKVPENQYFVMGDNRDQSQDSRFWGFVSDDDLSGKAMYVWMHKAPGLLNLPSFSNNRKID